MKVPSLKLFALVAATAFAAYSAAGILANDAAATHQPADKMAVAGSTVEILRDESLLGTEPTVATILSGTMRTSSTTDLVLSVTLECALWTTVATVGNEESEARATIKVWIEIDGEPVVVSGNESGAEDAGKVVFCDRTHRQSVTDLDDEDARIEQFLRTRTANAFNWISLNLGSGTHVIEVKAELDTAASEAGLTAAAIGKRTLVAEPTKLANDVVL